METIKPGKHLLNGVDTIKVYNNYLNEDSEGIAVILDGKVYEAYKDYCDGYRSYGSFFESEIPIKDIKNIFEAQTVNVELINIDEDPDEDHWNGFNYKGIKIYNTLNQLILAVGTDYSDDYYPCGNYEYHPENLPINVKLNN